MYSRDLNVFESFQFNFVILATDAIQCQEDDGNIIAQLYFFSAQLIAGVGQSLKHTLGISFLDDNIQKSKTPALICEFD